MSVIKPFPLFTLLVFIPCLLEKKWRFVAQMQFFDIVVSVFSTPLTKRPGEAYTQFHIWLAALILESAQANGKPISQAMGARYSTPVSLAALSPSPEPSMSPVSPESSMSPPESPSPTLGTPFAHPRCELLTGDPRLTANSGVHLDHSSMGSKTRSGGVGGDPRPHPPLSAGGGTDAWTISCYQNTLPWGFTTQVICFVDIPPDMVFKQFVQPSDEVFGASSPKQHSREGNQDSNEMIMMDSLTFGNIFVAFFF